MSGTAGVKPAVLLLMQADTSLVEGRLFIGKNQTVSFADKVPPSWPPWLGQPCPVPRESPRPLPSWDVITAFELLLGHGVRVYVCGGGGGPCSKLFLSRKINILHSSPDPLRS